MSPHRYILEVALTTNQRVRFIWSQSLHGAPVLQSLRKIVDSHNFDRTREEFGRRPWWWARIVDRETGKEVVYYRPAMDGLGRRVK